MTLSCKSLGNFFELTFKLTLISVITFNCAFIYAQVTDLPPLRTPDKSQQQSEKKVQVPSKVRPSPEDESKPKNTTRPLMPDNSTASSSEQQMMENACGYNKRTQGPASYYNCLNNQMNQLNSLKAKPNLSAASQREQQMMENACGYNKRTQGPASYYNCLNNQMNQLNSLGVK